MERRTLSTYLQDDLDQIAGVPDGDEIYVDFIGFEVPSFVDPRFDLIVPGQVKESGRLNHHVPMAMRGPFRPHELPDADMWTGEVDEEGFCVCFGKRKDGLPCRKAATNRSQFCAQHGGQLHPADKKMTKLADGLLPDISQIRKATRVQKVEMGLIPVSELADDEIRGQFVWNDDGRKVSSRKISDRIHRELTQEMMSRMNDKLANGLPDVLDTMLEMATDPIVEPADRIKASIWWAERVMGKTPDVVIHGKTDAPYEQIFTHLETTSRDEYRRAIEGSQDPNIIEGEVIEDGDLGSQGSGIGRDGVRDRSSVSGPNERSVESRGIADSDKRQSPGERGNDTGVDFSGTRLSFGIEDSDSDESVDVAPEDKPTAGEVSSKKLIDRKERLKLAREEQKKAKNRRFAARANGMIGVNDLPWVIDFKRIPGKSGNYTARFVAPEDQTPELLDRIAQAQALDDLRQPTP